jgi:phosphate transport system permease protein
MERIKMQSELSASRKVAQGLAASAPHIDLRQRPRIHERIIQMLLFFCGALSVLTTAGILYVLGHEALLFFQLPEVNLVDTFTKVKWQPAIGEFGIWPLLIATLTTSFIAMLIALPLGLMIAIYLSEYASVRVRGILKPILEVLAGIPTIVYGYFALTFMTPILRNIFSSDLVEIYNTASAGIVIGILILPLVTSMSEDALAAVPRALREAAYGLGATKLETSLRIVLPAALSGIAAAVIVAMSRAIGETMVVAVAAGAGPRNFNSWGEAVDGMAIFNPFKAAETMTGHIVRISGGDISYNSIDYSSLFAIGLFLFFMTLALNVISRVVVQYFREEYE